MCKQNKTIANYPELVIEWHPTKNGNLYPKDVAFSSKKNYWWICEIGHEWSATASNRTFHNSGCPYCSGRLASKNYCLANYPQLVFQLHPFKNNNLNPNLITPGSGEIVWWKCYDGKWPNGDIAEDHEWQAAIKCRTKRDSGCPYCCKQKISLSNCMATTHPEFIKQWSSKNNLTPFEIVSGTNKIIWWICERGHEWPASVASRCHSNKGCPYCSGCLASPENNLQKSNPFLSLEFNLFKNKITPDKVTPNSNYTYWWICSKCSFEWQSTVCNRTRCGCPNCNGKIVNEYNNLNIKPDIAKQWHPTKNGNVTPNDVFAHAHKKYWWICEKGHEWKAAPYNRCRINKSNKGGCPYCKESYGEKITAEYFEKNNINYSRQFKIKECKNKKCLPFDFAIQNPKLILAEINGHQHYRATNFGSKEKDADLIMFRKVVINDHIKKIYCETNKIKLIEIPYWELVNINKHLDDVMAGQDPVFKEEIPNDIKQWEDVKKEILRREFKQSVVVL